MPSVEVPNFSPQVFVRYAVDKPEELSRAYIGQRAIRYSVKAIETQSETLLAEFSYVVDIMNKRACGTNVGNVISNEAFLFDALAKPK